MRYGRPGWQLIPTRATGAAAERGPVPGREEECGPAAERKRTETRGLHGCRRNLRLL